MVTKSNIKEIISQQQKRVDDMKSELSLVFTPYARNALNDEIAALEDNIYRYKLQERAWRIDV